MDGIGGKRGWAWIFILEGLATVIIGIISIWMVFGQLILPCPSFTCSKTNLLHVRSDFPDEATFLSPEDRARVIRRLKADKQSSAEHESFKTSYLWASLKDWKTPLYALIYMGADMPLYAFSLFLPSIVQALGYKSTHAQLLSVPPYAAAAVATVAIGYTADRTNQRGLCNMFICLIGMIGFAMLIAGTSPAVQYAGTYLGAVGIYPCIANTIAWTANNTEGVYKRGITLGFVIGWGNLNGVVSSNIFQASDKPLYRTGHGIILAYLAIFLFGGSTLMHFLLQRENKVRRNGGRDYLVEGKSTDEVERMGDKKPEFLYIE